jgi:DNA repair protein RadC
VTRLAATLYEARRAAATAAGCGCPRQESPEGETPDAWPPSNPIIVDAQRRAQARAGAGPEGRSIEQAGSGPKGVGAACRPWLKVERDEVRYEACMAVAEGIGPIDSSKKAFEILKKAIGSEDQEVFGAMYLDTHLYLRGMAETGRGEIDSVMAPIKPTLRVALALDRQEKALRGKSMRPRDKEVLKLATEDGITGVLIFHCHPTLYSRPSESDKHVTRSFEDACPLLDLFFVDHIIVGGQKEFFSFADAGLLRDL